MKAFRICVCVVLAMSLAGCSVAETIIWGNDGAEVIRTTETFIDQLASEETSTLACADAELEVGAPSDWTGRSAGEPERFNPEYWEKQTALDPQWNINLEGIPDGAESGGTYPSDVFFRETDDGLCVVDVVWAKFEFSN